MGPQDASGVTGTAGGERRVADLERTALAALAAALAGLPQGAAVELRTGSAAILAIPRRIAAAK